MDLRQYDGEKVKIVDVDGQVFFGFVSDYFYPEDNEPEEESIVIDSVSGDLLEFYEKHIKSIEVLTKIEIRLMGILRDIWDDEEFVVGVMNDLETDEERKAVIDYINGTKGVTTEEIVLLSLNIDLTREEKRYKRDLRIDGECDRPLSTVNPNPPKEDQERRP